MTKHDKEVLGELSKEQLVYLIEQMKCSLCKIGEACVEESKGHRPPEKAIEDIRGYIFDIPSLIDAMRAKETIDLMMTNSRNCEESLKDKIKIAENALKCEICVDIYGNIKYGEIQLN